ncbi:MAG: recombinase family protein [Methylobacterium sp.]|nr:recombinase family protein [Methylobacterium sp.]MCA3652386.1 recombinase family protein [Methylobacterium sp.]
MVGILDAVVDPAADLALVDAQREACAAYITSQKAGGWKALPAIYDDGGFSGGSMDRPGLKRLMADIATGQIDVVVVYKIDRLTRSLADFARMVELFERHAVSFVSVTQAFSTTTSMGRLTLNVLLSFAQFEREVTGERIRDKIAASKKKGLWMGGTIPLGYDLPDPGLRVLRVNEPEADLVRQMFARYLELGSVHALERDLAARGVRTKQTPRKDGTIRGGVAFSRGALFHLLRNRERFGVELPVEPGALKISERIARIEELSRHTAAAVAADRKRVADIRAMMPIADRLGFDINEDWCVRSDIKPEFLHRGLSAKAGAEGVPETDIARAGVRIILLGRD